MPLLECYFFLSISIIEATIFKSRKMQNICMIPFIEEKYQVEEQNDLSSYQKRTWCRGNVFIAYVCLYKIYTFTKTLSTYIVHKLQCIIIAFFSSLISELGYKVRKIPTKTAIVFPIIFTRSFFRQLNNLEIFDLANPSPDLCYHR